MSKLPTLVIKNPFSTSPKIKTKINKLWLSIRLFVVGAVIAITASKGLVAHNYYEYQTNLRNTVATENQAAMRGEDSTVIKATSEIIARDGNVPADLAKKYSFWIYEAAVKHNVDPVTILAIMYNESRFNYKAVSPTGPRGLMQVAARWHPQKINDPSDLFDPKKNIFVGAQIMSEYGKATSTEAGMLIRYNAQPGYAPTYAIKVLATKRKYDSEITEAIVKSI